MVPPTLRALTAHRATLAIITALALAACSSPKASLSDAAPTSTPPPPRADAAAAGTNTCTSAATCAKDEVCDLETGTCTSDRPACITHEECGPGAYCDDASQCKRNHTGGSCDDEMSCLPQHDCIGGVCGCDGQTFTATVVASNVLIVLDRSSSMTDRIGGQSKWTLASTAVNTLLTEFSSGVRFGLVLYPHRTACGPGPVRVEVGDDTAAAVQAAIAGVSPGGNTPIGDTLSGLVNYAGLEDPTRENYILLITDGQEVCGRLPTPIAQYLLAKSPSVKTFVVGFGSAVLPSLLNDLAKAGGTALPGDPKYYQADDLMSLTEAFRAIGGSVWSCTYELDTPPAGSLDELYVYFDTEAVDRDTTRTNGWDYEASSNRLTFYGPACQSLRQGDVDELAIVHGCPIVVD